MPALAGGPCNFFRANAERTRTSKCHRARTTRTNKPAHVLLIKKRSKLESVFSRQPVYVGPSSRAHATSSDQHFENRETLPTVLPPALPRVETNQRPRTFESTSQRRQHYRPPTLRCPPSPLYLVYFTPFSVDTTVLCEENECPLHRTFCVRQHSRASVSDKLPLLRRPFLGDSAPCPRSYGTVAHSDTSEPAMQDFIRSPTKTPCPCSTDLGPRVQVVTLISADVSKLASHTSRLPAAHLRQPRCETSSTVSCATMRTTVSAPGSAAPRR